MLSAFLAPRRPFFLLVSLICLSALSAALIGQYGFDLHPCILCLYERIPYVTAGLTGLAMALLPTSPRLRRLGLLLIGLSFAANTALGFYHVGVEQHWWTNPGCTGGPLNAMSLADLQSSIQKAVRPACDDVQWSLFGITLAGYNLLLSLAMTALTVLAGRKAA
ncbi:disulfide bond formation protein B [Novispirillum itersonii]|uniref:disulfide bond formation protein B n=1 Tax=Novispirillum itersonii TaxID=189 RepID=UPI00037F271F|nr:disulfide bond formation protein B [Novispirillum itersonii]